MSLKILNLNTWLLPLRLSSHNKKRLKYLFNLVRMLEPDVITLQEVWDISYLKRFRKVLGDYILLAFPNSLFNEGGLVTLSKLPVIKNSISHFKVSKDFKLIERIAKKGFMVTTIDFHGKKVDVVNTHLYQSDAFSPQRHRKITLDQFFRVHDFFNDAKNPVFLCGDFNMNYSFLKRLRMDFFFPHKNSLTTVARRNKYSNKKFNRTRIAERQLDYCIYRENGVKLSVKTQVFDDLLLSDHYPLYTEVNFN